MPRIPIAGPWITQKEIDYVCQAVSSAWYEQANDFNQRFEEAFAQYLGVKYAVSLPSCTSAIHLALASRGIGPGDEVIVPEATWIATAAPISYVGATPVFADIDQKSWCLTRDAFEAGITEKTKAVIPVDLYGNMAEMDGIRDLAHSYGIFVIEDAAEAVGAELNGRRAGSWGDVGVFSFHGSKTLTTGEGGMLVTDEPDVYKRVLKLRDHGRADGDKLFWNDEIAFKYRMSSMQAALGLAQLERIDELTDKKRRIFQWYSERLSCQDSLTLNHERSGVLNVYWMNTVVLDPAMGISKEQLMARLKEAQIDTRPFFYPLSSMPPYTDLPNSKNAAKINPVAYRLSPYALNLPSAVSLQEHQIEYVCETLKGLLS